MITKAETQRHLDCLKATLISVSTGGPRIDLVNGEYQHHYREATAGLLEHGISDPLPFQDLWAWYGRWSEGDLPKYADRRAHVAKIFQPFAAQLAGQVGRGIEITGWDRLDRTMRKATSTLRGAQNEEDFQGVGHLCREALISLAQAVWDAERHPILDGVSSSPTDAKRMLEAYILVEIRSASNEAARKLARASLDLSNTLQHRRTATFRDAALCLEATTSVVNVIAIVAGRRDPIAR